MRILISAVSSSRQPSGICRHAANLASCLAGEQAVSQVTLLVGKWQREYFRDAFKLRYKAVSLVSPDVSYGAFARNAWYYFGLPAFARQYRADIVHLSFPVPILRTAFPCAVVCSLHDLYPYDAPRNFGQTRVLFNRWFLRQCLHSSDAVVCSSGFTLERLRHYASRVASPKAMRIYQAVTLDPGDQRAPAIPDLATQPFLLTVAQHRSNKNLDLLLSAFAEVRRRTAPLNLRLVIVGAEGPETGKLHSLAARRSLQDDVLFLSGLPDAELCWLYRRCELLVITSTVEGFCFPVVEALRCGSRVLCSDIPVLREVGGHSCRYFDLKQPQPEALVKAIEDAVLRTPTRQPFADRFSVETISREYVALYSSLLGPSPLPHSDAQLPTDSVRYDRYAS